MSRARLAAALVACSLACSAPASAQVAERLDDLRLATAVRLALVDDVRTRALDVSVVARGGGVEVQGRVGRGDQVTVAEVARAVPGVRVVGGSAASDARAPREPAGPVVRVPPRPSDPVRPAEGGPLYHTVERGDTLFGLARRYDTSVDAIQALNGRQSSGIQVGQRLRVR